jgi:hypothetical protein
MDGLNRERSRSDIAADDDKVRVFEGNLLQYRFKSWQVAMYVRKRGDSHGRT